MKVVAKGQHETSAERGETETVAERGSKKLVPSLRKQETVAEGGKT